MDDTECQIDEFKITTDIACTVDATTGPGTKYNTVLDGLGNL